LNPSDILSLRLSRSYNYSYHWRNPVKKPIKNYINTRLDSLLEAIKNKKKTHIVAAVSLAQTAQIAIGPLRRNLINFIYRFIYALFSFFIDSHKTRRSGSWLI